MVENTLWGEVLIPTTKPNRWITRHVLSSNKLLKVCFLLLFKWLSSLTDSFIKYPLHIPVVSAYWVDVPRRHLTDTALWTHHVNQQDKTPIYSYHSLKPNNQLKLNIIQRVYHCCCTDLCVCAKLLQSCLTLGDLMHCTCLAPLSLGFSRQEYWSGLSCPPPGNLPDQDQTLVSCISCFVRQHLGSILQL